MDLRRLRHFVMAAEESNFRRAALRLDTNQSIISRHVRDIEEELGADLFHREPGHGARLTEVVVLKHLALIVCLTSTLVLAQTSIAGEWMLTQDLYGNPLHQKLTLKVDGTVLSGTLGRRPLDAADVTGRPG